MGQWTALLIPNYTHITSCFFRLSARNVYMSETKSFSPVVYFKQKVAPPHVKLWFLIWCESSNLFPIPFLLMHFELCLGKSSFHALLGHLSFQQIAITIQKEDGAQADLV